MTIYRIALSSILAKRRKAGLYVCKLKVFPSRNSWESFHLWLAILKQSVPHSIFNGQGIRLPHFVFSGQLASQKKKMAQRH